MTRVPFQPRYFSLGIDGAPRLMGSYSPQADTCFFPPRRNCPITGGPVEDRILSAQGVLHSWTYIYENRVGKDVRGDGGYGIGEIDLPEGPRIQARLIGNFGDWQIGMTMALESVPLTAPRPPDPGVSYVTFAFRSAGAPA